MRSAVILLAFLLPLDAPRPRSVTKTGQVVLLTTALKQKGIPADAGPIANQVVLLEDDGSLTPLLSDEASRGLFTDARLRDRKSKLSGRIFEGSPYLQVTAFQIEEDGKLRTPEYYCDVCTISVRYPQTCPCCQGPMELRMKPENP